MGQRSADGEKAQVIQNGHSQSVLLPATFSFQSEEVFVRRDERSGVISLSEQPFRPSLEEVFKAFDEAIASGETFELDRDGSLPEERDLF